MEKTKIWCLFITLLLALITAGCNDSSSQETSTAEAEPKANTAEDNNGGDNSNLNGKDWNDFSNETKTKYTTEFLNSFDYSYTAEEVSVMVDEFYSKEENKKETIFVAMDIVLSELVNSDLFALGETNEFFGQGAFSDLVGTEYINNFTYNSQYDVVEKDGKTIVTFLADDRSIRQSIAQDGNWIKKDKEISRPETGRCTDADSIIIHGEFVFGDCDGTLNYHDANGNNGSLTDYDTFMFVKLKNDKFAILTEQDNINTIHSLEGKKEISFRDKYDLNIFEGVADPYFDEETNELYFPNSRGVSRLNVITEEPLYDGAEEKVTEFDDYVDEADHIRATKSNQLLIASYLHGEESVLDLYDGELNKINSIAIPFSLAAKDIRQSFSNGQTTFWEVIEYQNKPALKSTIVKIPK